MLGMIPAAWRAEADAVSRGSDYELACIAGCWNPALAARVTQRQRETRSGNVDGWYERNGWYELIRDGLPVVTQNYMPEASDLEVFKPTRERKF